MHVTLLIYINKYIYIYIYIYIYMVYIYIYIYILYFMAFTEARLSYCSKVADPVLI